MASSDDIGVGEIPSAPLPAAGKRKERRSSTDLREENVGIGALLLRIIWDGVNWLCPSVASVPETEKNYKFNNVDGKDPNKREGPYRTCERKGFRVCKGTGCFAPHSQYSTSGGGASEKGYQRIFFAVFGWIPKFYEGSAKPPTDPATGKDLSWQLSHLCHCRWCCRLDHLCVEQRWRNFVRNFCMGPLRKFRLPDGKKIDTCGCSVQFHVMGKPELAGPPCLAAYKVTPDTPPADLDICKSFGEVGHVLRETGFPFKVAYVTYTKRETISQLRALQSSKDPADKAKLKTSISLLSPASKKMMKSGGAIVFDVHDMFEPNVDPNKTVVVLPDPDEGEAAEEDTSAKKKHKSKKTT